MPRPFCATSNKKATPIGVLPPTPDFRLKMELSSQQALEILKRPQNKAALAEAKEIEERVRLHTKAVHSAERAPTYFRRYLRWVKERIKLPAEKYELFEALCQFPLPTTALCNSIFDEYEKIFTAQDAFRDVELLDDSLKEEFLTYLKGFDLPEYLRTIGFDGYRKSYNCLYVVDLPSEQTTTRPEPYFYTVPLQALVDVGVEVQRDGRERVGYAAYSVGGDRYVVICDGYYRLFEKVEGGTLDAAVEYRLVSESAHDLGYTPATFFAQRNVYDPEDGNRVAKKLPLIDSLGDLDWLLFFKVAQRMFETYGPFPITVVPEDRCDFTDTEGNTCQGGWIAYHNALGEPSQKRCPVCAEKASMAGPGTVITKPIPKTKEDPELTKPVEIIGADVDSLKYITEKVDLLEWEIYENCVGGTDQTAERQAINADQVQNSVEGKRNILMAVKKDFEQVEMFLTDTMGRLMMGEYYVGSTVNLGEQFLLYSVRDVLDQYKAYKENGLPNFLVNSKKELLIQTEYKNNPIERKRAEILNVLEPWSELSIKDCREFQFDVMWPDKFFLKLEFAKFVSKFERVNGNIVQWGSLLPLDTKIDRITKILLEYVKQEPQPKPIPTEPGTGAGAKSAKPAKTARGK